MNLQSVKIMNYRSIEELSFDIELLDDGSFTYGLIGINEAGKSTILKALALKDGLIDAKGQLLPLQKDFKDKTKSICIEYLYFLHDKEINTVSDLLMDSFGEIDQFDINNFKTVKVSVIFPFSTPSQKSYTINFPELKEGYHEDVINILESSLQQFIINNMHRSIFWTAEDKYLISQPINLVQFANDADNVSIPLKNCFYLAGISNIQERINSINGDTTEIEQLQTDLGKKITEHIKSVWPNHPIEITFLINDGHINFHVKDLGTLSKAKTADQRSDGFRQFVSFLLTISAQNKNEELSNSILLLDEPETHLHPKAQENLLNELIQLTKNKRNNIVFFATHSNYMIDKNDLSRNFQIIKEGEITEKNQFNKEQASYASVNYDVFDVVTTDYHNELYGYLESFDKDNPEQSKLDKIKTEKDRNNAKTGKKYKVSLSQYIRDSIHHPENTLNAKFTEAELKRSIEILRKLI